MQTSGSIAGIGLDLVPVETVALALKRDPDAAAAWLTEPELESWRVSGSVIATLAGRVAAKEAVVKALRTGFNDVVAWQDVEIVANADGAPEVRLAGGALAEASRKGVRRVLVSISHVASIAAATAVAVE